MSDADKDTIDQSGKRSKAEVLAEMHSVDLGVRRLLLVVGALGLVAFLWPPVLWSFVLGSIFSPFLALLYLSGPIFFLISVLNAPQGKTEAIGLPMIAAIGGGVDIAFALTIRGPTTVNF